MPFLNSLCMQTEWEKVNDISKFCSQISCTDLDAVFVCSHLDVLEYVKHSECMSQYRAIHQCEGYDTQPQSALAQATGHPSGHQVGVNAKYDHHQVDKHNTHNEDHIQVWAGQTNNPVKREIRM